MVIVLIGWLNLEHYFELIWLISYNWQIWPKNIFLKFVWWWLKSKVAFKYNMHSTMYPKLDRLYRSKTAELLIEQNRRFMQHSAFDPCERNFNNNAKHCNTFLFISTDFLQWYISTSNTPDPDFTLNSYHFHRCQCSSLQKAEQSCTGEWT